MAANEPEQRALALGLWAPAFFAALLAAAYELGPRQTDAYLGPGLASPRWLALLLLTLSAALGSVAGARLLRAAASRSQLLLRLLAALSALCALSGAGWFWAFGAPRVVPIFAVGMPVSAGLLVGLCAGALGRAVALPYRELASIRLLLAPLPLFGALLLTLLLTSALSYAGIWRAAALLAAVLAGLSLHVSHFADYLGDLRAAPRRPAVFALCLAGASLATSQAYVPARLLSRYPGDVVWTQGDAVVISAQNTFELFEQGHLRLSSADDYRFAELAVHPLLASLTSPRRVLLFGPGGGLLEREVLRYPSVEEALSVSELDHGALRESLWPASRTPTDPRVRYLQAEPLPWLEREQSRFDAIIVALPAPADAATAKHYSRYFYQLLAARLTTGGGVAVQAASHDNPGTVRAIAATMQHVGLALRGYEAPVPLLGSLAFLVGGVPATPALERAQLPSGLRYLDQAGLSRALSLGLPLSAEPTTPVTTLDRLRVSEVWHREQVALGYD